MADWADTNPDTDTLYTDVLTALRDRDKDALTQGVGTLTNPPTSALRFNRTTKRWEEWSGAAWADAAAIIPQGTVMVFYQASAPTGWTKLTTQNDKALRVVSGSGGGVGGTHGLSSPPSTAHTHVAPAHSHTAPAHTHTVASHTHAYSTVIAHTHTFTTNSDGAHAHSFDRDTAGAGGVGGDTGNSATGTRVTHTDGTHVHAGTTNSTGSASANTGASGVLTTSSDGATSTSTDGSTATSSNGPTAFAPAYIDVILCSKN